MRKMPKIEIARIYDHELEEPAAHDATTHDAATHDAASHDAAVRVLVDRLWPRGVSREKAAIDLWPKDATPSSELRTSWHADPLSHDPEHFEAFKAAYRAELETEPARSALKQLADELSGASHVYLFTAAKTPEMSHVPAIAEALDRLLTEAIS